MLGRLGSVDTQTFTLVKNSRGGAISVVVSYSSLALSMVISCYCSLTRHSYTAIACSQSHTPPASMGHRKYLVISQR